MTIIVACKGSDGIVWIGSDRMVSRSNYPNIVDGEPKWRLDDPEMHGNAPKLKSGVVAIGWSGSLRLGYLIDNLNLPWGTPWQMAGAIKEGCRADHWVPDKDDDACPQSFGGQSVMVTRDQSILVLDSAMTPVRVGDFGACGSGSQYAYGAHQVLARADTNAVLGVTTRGLVARILDAAIALDPGCGGEPWIAKALA